MSKITLKNVDMVTDTDKQKEWHIYEPFFTGGEECTVRYGQSLPFSEAVEILELRRTAHPFYEPSWIEPVDAHQ